MDKETIAKLDLLINTAATEGVNSALEKHGEIINGREAMALSRLTPEELQTMAKLNSKITDLAGGKAAADWTCGLFC